MTTQLGRDFLILTDHLIEDLGVGSKDGVNAAALAVTTGARAEVRRVAGGDQRLSGVIYRRRTNKRGKTRVARIGEATRQKGGTRVNPYYRQAESDTNPTAIVGVRGPAHLLEHGTAGHWIYPRDRDALLTPEGERSSAWNTGISNPRRPVNRTFDRAGPLVQAKAADALWGTLSDKGWTRG